MPPITKLRDSREGGGVAIYVHKTAKVVPLLHYDIKDLEAVWAEIMIGNVRLVVGSVYIPPGQLQQLHLLRGVLQRICTENSDVVIGMDANARNHLWEADMVSENSTNQRMGEVLADILMDCSMEVLNDGSAIYHKGQYKLHWTSLRQKEFFVIMYVTGGFLMTIYDQITLQ